MGHLLHKGCERRPTNSLDDRSAGFFAPLSPIVQDLIGWNRPLRLFDPGNKFTHAEWLREQLPAQFLCPGLVIQREVGGQLRKLQLFASLENQPLKKSMLFEACISTSVTIRSAQLLSLGQGNG